MKVPADCQGMFGTWVRFATTYGERAQRILAGARTTADLGMAFGATLTQAEVHYLKAEELPCPPPGCKVVFSLLRPHHISFLGSCKYLNVAIRRHSSAPLTGLVTTCWAWGAAIHARRHPCQLSLSSTMTAIS
jgi:hypothetical protein